MLAFLTAFTLATAADPPPCCLRPTTFSPPAVTARETGNRIGHVISPAIMTTSFYGAALYFGARKPQARIIAAGLSCATIVLKEIYDYNTAARNFSRLDIGLGLIGIAGGLAVAEIITWPEERRAPR